jgi:HlyD family secretion protein
VNKKRLIIVALIALIVITVIIILTFRNRDNGDALVLSGNVEVTEAHVGFKLPGRIIELFVDEGYKVSKGEKLAQLDSDELGKLVLQQKAFVGEASDRFRELKTGSRSQEIEQAKASLAAADADLVKAQKDFARAEMLFKKDAISASQFDSYKSAHDASTARRKAAVENLSLVREGPRREMVSAAEQRVSQARASLGASEYRLQDTVLLAPFDGVVLRKNVEKGEIVGQGTPVFSIGDLEHPWIKVYVKEDRLGMVKLGQKAEITVDSFPGKKYQGTVTYISSEAEFTPKNVQTKEERVKLVFGVKVSVVNQNGELKPGMPADVFIQLK